VNLLLAFIAGITTHKVWRVGMRMYRPRRPLGRAIQAEFAPGDDPGKKSRRDRPPSVTEIA
jgi:hypothetical protein